MTSTKSRAGRGGLGLAVQLGLLALIGVAAPVALALHLAVDADDVAARLDAQDRRETDALSADARAARAVPSDRISALIIAPQRVLTLTRVFDRYDYRLDRIAQREDGVPPIFVETLPGDWRSMEQAEKRKRVFVKTVLPLVLRANAEIREDRARLMRLLREADGDLDKLSAGSRYWLGRLAARYDLEGIDLDALKRRVDVIPVSLALAQAAKESGWGTSRFAHQGNALFGQWTWRASAGIAPRQRQAGKGNYAVRKFPDLATSVQAYMHNLNTHAAYADMREQRVAMRAAGKTPTGKALATHLTRYSQRGKAYVKDILGMISYNRFERYEKARLGSAALG